MMMDLMMDLMTANLCGYPNDVSMALLWDLLNTCWTHSAVTFAGRTVLPVIFFHVLSFSFSCIFFHFLFVFYLFMFSHFLSFCVFFNIF